MHLCRGCVATVLAEISPHPKHLNPHMEVATRIDFSENQRGNTQTSLAHVSV